MKVPKDITTRVQWIYSSSDSKELAERYDQWAKDYDANLENEFGWVGPRRAVEFFRRYVPKDDKILDAGAGTGLVGQMLAEYGYKDLTAMDLSQGMLEEARKKGVYRAFHRMVMGEHLDYATGAFGAVISVGVLTLGHAPASSFDELIRITKPGGYIVFSLRPDVYRNSGFKEKQDESEAEGKWRPVAVSEEFKTLPKGEPDIYHQIWVYQITSRK